MREKKMFNKRYIIKYMSFRKNKRSIKQEM